MKIVVLGRSGQLARALARAPIHGDATLVSLGRDALDLTDASTTAAVLGAQRADLIINAAAYTAVDKAESEPAAAFALNRDAPAAIARFCAESGARLVHVSTDYVFDGAKAGAYVEDDARAPLNVYGRSKAEGEDAVLNSGADAVIVRTSWVYAAEGANFLRTMLRLAETRDEIGVVDDQIGAPTWAADLADACLAAGAATARGAFHYAAAGAGSWADFAEAVFTEAAQRGLPHARVKRISARDYPTAAARPANSRLDTSKFERAFGVVLRPWREALGACMGEVRP